MIKITEKLVKAVNRGKKFIAVAKMVLAELASRIALWLQRLSDGDVTRLKAYRRAREAPVIKFLRNAYSEKAFRRGA